MQSRIQKLSLPALAAEKAKIKADYDSRIDAAVEKAQRAAERQFQSQIRGVEQRARIDVQREMAKQIQEADNRAKAAEDRRLADIQRARKEAEAESKRNLAQSMRLAEAQTQAKMQRLQAEKDRDKIRHEAESIKLQGKLDDLSRRLEKQSGEQLGSEAELDLFTELRGAFPSDRFERIGKGVKGADILHVVMDGSRQIGKIVYESKNTLTWLNEFIMQAKKYRTQYETPHVVVVTRVFPAKQKGFCVVKDIPVVESRMAIALATIIREGIVEIAKLRVSGSSRDGKSQELYEYIVGDKFCTRFRELAEGIDALRMQQANERRWHENTWQSESKLHELIASRHSEVDAQIHAICRGVSTLDGARLPARSALKAGTPYMAASSR
jgi:hypothetical protein